MLLHYRSFLRTQEPSKGCRVNNCQGLGFAYALQQNRLNRPTLLNTFFPHPRPQDPDHVKIKDMWAFVAGGALTESVRCLLEKNKPFEPHTLEM